MLKEFPIYFSNLNEETKEQLLKFVNVKDPSEMNWDVDMCPLALYPFDTEVNSRLRGEIDGMHNQKI